MGKRVLSLLLAVMLCLMLGAAPVSAVETRGAVGDAISNFWDGWLKFNSPLYSIVSKWLENGKTPETATGEDWQNAYNQYTVNIQNNYGTTNINSGGAGIFYPSGWDVGWGKNRNFSSTLPSSCRSFEYTASSNLSFFALVGYLESHVVFMSKSFTVPVSGSYALVFPHATIAPDVIGGSRAAVDPTALKQLLYNDSQSYVSNSQAYSCAANLTWFFSASSRSVLLVKDTFYQINVQVPIRWTNSDTTLATFSMSSPYLILESAFSSGLVNVSSDSRVGTFSGNFSFENVNGDIIMAENVQIVNETNNTFYNPVTGNTYNINNWTYDYSTRGYQLTLESGVVLSVTFGDEGVFIQEGDKTYNLYYAVPEQPEPSPAPEPSSTPGPSPSPTPPVDPEKPDENKGLLQGIWDAIVNLGTTIVDGLLSGLRAFFLPSEESIKDFSGQVDLKLPLIGDLQGLGNELVGTLENPGQSVNDLRMTTVVDLGKGGGGLFGSTRINLLDMSWYMEYKPLVDDVIVGFLWLVFLWNLYGALPGIIHGGASGLHTTAQIQAHSNKHAK